MPLSIKRFSSPDIHTRFLWAALLLCVWSASGCHGRRSSSTVPDEGEDVADVSAMHFHAQGNGDGDFDIYSADDLFAAALRADRAGDCEQAVVLYQRILAEFGESDFVIPSHYNAGLCQQEAGRIEEAVGHFQAVRTLEALPGRVARNASMRLLSLYLLVDRPADTLNVAEELLSTRAIRPIQRVELSARQAQAYYALGQLDEAYDATLRASGFYRRYEDAGADPEYAAIALYIRGEVFRQRAEAMPLPLASVEEQHQVLEARTSLVRSAETSYHQAVRHGHPLWAARAGHRIGGLYDGLWSAVIEAPVTIPDDLQTEEEQNEFTRVYRLRLAEMIEPLLRHSINAWEVTLSMLDRVGGSDPEVVAIRGELEEDLSAQRERLLRWRQEGRIDEGDIQAGPESELDTEP